MAAVRARATQLAQQMQKTLQTRVKPAYASTEKYAVEQYNKLMSENQQYVVKDPEAADKLLKQYVYTNLARIPKGLEVSKSEAQEVRGEFARISEMPLPEASRAAAQLAVYISGRKA